MQLNAKGPESLANSGVHTVVTAMTNHQIDVSAMAQRAMFTGHIALDSEAFGVAVTRRAEAKIGNLDPVEECRLLDVLVHARKHQHNCDEDGVEFPLWVVSSDSRDNRVRAIWMVLKSVSPGSYAISLSDV